jgi:hypothetical protein
MRHFEGYLNAGKPVIGLRTATHAFAFPDDAETSYRHWSYDSGTGGWEGGFGQRILGDTWISHHGKHKEESQRGVVNEAQASHPVLRGVRDQWGPTDVYGIRNLPEEATVLVYGQVLAGMEPDSPPVEGPKNDPMMPVSWIKEYSSPDGRTTGQAVCSTFFSSKELENEGIRRLLVNSAYFLTGLADAIRPDLDVSLAGDYQPSMYGFQRGDYWVEKGLKPADFAGE